MNRVIGRSLLALAGLVTVAAGTSWGQLQFELEPIRYTDAPVHDRVVELQERIDSGAATLEFDSDHGYLPAVLEMLNVPVSSQMLVFSQTSFQLRRISPRRPRAIYFSDDTYVGWVQGGDVVEVSSVDPTQGAIFYTLEQSRSSKPKFVRDRGQCTTCHASSRTQGVPGHLVRSVYADYGGRPLLGSGTFTSDHRSPFEQRWGGWYVTGTHGSMRHMGNSLSRDRSNPETLDTEAGANRADLEGLVDTSPYLTSTSDIVALMVLEHQTQMHNFLTLANFETRHAVHYDEIMRKALGEAEGYRSESTTRRIAKVADKAVRYMLFADEFPLTAPVEGVSPFASEFAGLGPKDRRGRSLRDFDLVKRMFKYPCSYLIYSESFDRLPDEVRQEVYLRLVGILSGRDETGDFERLSESDRRAIREILIETKREFRERYDVAAAGT